MIRVAASWQNKPAAFAMTCFSPLCLTFWVSRGRVETGSCPRLGERAALMYENHLRAQNVQPSSTRFLPTRLYTTIS
jgi:hypothetical protein